MILKIIGIIVAVIAVMMIIHNMKIRFHSSDIGFGLMGPAGMWAKSLARVPGGCYYLWADNEESRHLVCYMGDEDDSFTKISETVEGDIVSLEAVGRGVMWSVINGGNVDVYLLDSAESQVRCVGCVDFVNRRCMPVCFNGKLFYPAVNNESRLINVMCYDLETEEAAVFSRYSIYDTAEASLICFKGNGELLTVARYSDENVVEFSTLNLMSGMEIRREKLQLLQDYDEFEDGPSREIYSAVYDADYDARSNSYFLHCSIELFDHALVQLEADDDTFMDGYDDAQVVDGTLRCRNGAAFAVVKDGDRRNLCVWGLDMGFKIVGIRNANAYSYDDTEGVLYYFHNSRGNFAEPELCTRYIGKKIEKQLFDDEEDED